jgi:predicted membrane protein
MRCHPHSARQRQQRRVVFGVFFILAGVLALLANLQVVSLGDIGRYWPTIFCVLGLLKLLQARRLSSVMAGLGLMVLGAGWTLQNLGVIQHAMALIVPVLLILAGIGVLTRAFRPREARFGRPAGRVMQDEQDGVVNVDVTLSGTVLRSDAQDFRGGELRAVMGSIELDLRQASMSSTAVLRVFAVCGGIQIRIPADWQLRLNVSPVLGGVEDKTVPPPAGGKTLQLEGEVVMGGVQVKN